jgi:hypothetical protein
VPDGPGSPPPDRPIISDVPERGRYEAQLDQKLAGFLEYVVRHALDDARTRELRVIALCEYVQGYLARHPGDEDIVVGRAPSPR